MEHRPKKSQAPSEQNLSIAPATRHSNKYFGHNLGNVSDRHQSIHTMEKAYHLTELCEAFEVSCSSYYVWGARQPSARQQANAQLLESIQTLRQIQESGDCSPRMTEELQARG